MMTLNHESKSRALLSCTKPLAHESVLICGAPSTVITLQLGPPAQNAGSAGEQVSHSILSPLPGSWNCPALNFTLNLFLSDITHCAEFCSFPKLCPDFQPSGTQGSHGTPGCRTDLVSKPWRKHRELFHENHGGHVRNLIGSLGL
jgi:hypothetical protein